MTSDASNQPVGPRAQTMAFQSVANRIVRGLLRVPLLNRAVGARLVTLYIVGRKTGRHLAVPVAYTRLEGDLVVGTPFGWGRNLRTGDPVDILLRGRRRVADVQVFATEPDVVHYYAIMSKDNRNFAKFNKIGFDENGEPSAEDLHLAAVGGARAFRLSPRA